MWAPLLTALLGTGLTQAYLLTAPNTSDHLNRGSFRNPARRIRPKFRYWIPDASVDPTVVASDVKAAGDVGMGGMELLGYYLYGGPPSNGAGRGTYAPDDWAVYGFGSEAWDNIFRAFVQATRDNDLILDFAIGPNQGTGVPSPENSDGLMWDIAAYNVSVPAGTSFDGQAPGWGAGQFYAAVSGLAINSTVVERVDQLAPDPGSLPGDLSLNRTQITLATDSLEDITSRVSSDGHLQVDFANTTAGINNTIFAIYLIHSHYRAQDGPLEMGGPQTAPATWLQNGSWAADHFSALGAKTISDFWVQYILPNGSLALLQGVGNYAWEDSVEIEANVYWTKDLLSSFQTDHGYSLVKYFPTLFHRNGHYRNSNPNVWWVTDEPDEGNGHIADYRNTLTKGYHEYLATLNAWAESYLNMSFSAQIGYNLPVDMLADIPSVDAPECESLDFSDLIDGYRQYAGPANLAERRIVSSECGAVRGEGFAQTLPELMWKVKRSYAGSINQFVFHGYPYSGQYPNTTWPVFTTFNYQYSGMHGPHEPAWALYKDQMDFVARNNWVLQAGQPRMDVAIWQKQTVYPGHIQLRTYEPMDLEDAGYTYEYLSPENLDLPAAKVVDGVLAPDAQAFKAMVVRVNDSLTVDGVAKLVEYAKAGLPIVLAGGIPETYVGTYSPIAVRASQRSLRSAATLSNVHVTDTFLVAATLASAGVQPRTRIMQTSPSNANIFTDWRHDAEDDVDYVFVYNDAMYSPQGTGAANVTIAFETTGVPYVYDTWTGDQKPLLAYKTRNGETTVPMTLAGNQSTVLAFRCSESADQRPQHLPNLPDGVLGWSSNSNGSLVVDIATSGAETLPNWTLIVEHWEPSSDLYNITATQKYNTTHHLSSLAPWCSIDGLQNVSGIGYYRTTFSWPLSPAAEESDGAVLDFGWIYHTLRASLNGHALPPLDVTAPTADISEMLVDGENVLEAVVATPLGNVLIPIWDSLMTSGEGPGSPDSSTVPPPKGDYGLQAEVVLKPYRIETADAIRTV